MSAPAARICLGEVGTVLYRTPVSAAASAGKVTILLGYAPSGTPVTLESASLDWLDDLESAIQVARAAGIVEAGLERIVP